MHLSCMQIQWKKLDILIDNNFFRRLKKEAPKVNNYGFAVIPPSTINSVPVI
jgi:hypothetical protein